MDLYNENLSELPKETLIHRYIEILKYVEFLETKNKEFEKLYNVDIRIREKTPFNGFNCSKNYVQEIEIIRIPERKFFIAKKYSKEVEEIINQYLRNI